MDQMKGMGMAPHLNPAFLQEMAAQGNAGAKQNMVSNKKCVICCICKNYHIAGNFFFEFHRLLSLAKMDLSILSLC